LPWGRPNISDKRIVVFLRNVVVEVDNPSLFPVQKGSLSPEPRLSVS